MIDAGPQELSWGSATRFDRLDRSKCFCRRDRVERFAEQLDNATGVQVDSTKLEQLDALYKQIGAEKGRIDVLFANAGGGSMLPLGDITESHYDDTFDRNVKGVLFYVQKALPLLARHASVILTGSTAGSSGTAAFSVYSASKAAVRAFARSWILDLKDRNVRVNTISPGATRTPGLVDVAGPDAAKQQGLLDYLASLIPMGPVGIAGRLPFVEEVRPRSYLANEVLTDVHIHI